MKISICHERRTTLMGLDVRVLPEQWDPTAQVVIRHSNKRNLNAYLGKRKNEVERILINLMDTDLISGMRASDVRDYVQEQLSPQAKKAEPEQNTFGRWFKRFIERKEGRTRGIYEATYKRLTAYCPKVDKLAFEAVNKEWLQKFDAFLAQTSPSANARNIHLRNIRAVFNDAIDNEVTAAYPFRRFKIRPEATRKRNFKVELLRQIFDGQGLERWEQKYLDFCKLTFMLIGINVVDLCNLSEVADGRVEYVRAKTHKPYSIKVEPEAMAIIEKYRGKSHLLSYLDTNHNYRCFYANLVKGLNSIRAKLCEQGMEVKELTTYWMRHSWATIAASLDIPKDTIAAALGHGGHSVTDIYIEFDRRKVDEANRRVLDWVLYGRR